MFQGRLKLGCLVAVGAARLIAGCGSPSTVGPGATPDAAEAPGTADATATTSDGRVTAHDASGATDARQDGDAATLDASAGKDATVDGGVAGPVPIVVGADGVLRGTVSGPVEHRWHGEATAGSASCPAGSVVVGACCEWDGAYVTASVVNIPVVFDPATRAGTLAGAPIGPFGAGMVGPTGVITWQINPSAFHWEKGWVANEAMGVGVEAPATVAASQHFFALKLVREILISVSSARVTWDPGAGILRLLEAHPLTPLVAGPCKNATGRTSWNLASP